MMPNRTFLRMLRHFDQLSIAATGRARLEADPWSRPPRGLIAIAVRISLGRARGTFDEATEAALLAELVLTPGLVAATLKLEPAAETSGACGRPWGGRGTAYL